MTVSAYYYSLIYRHDYQPPRVIRKALKASQLHYIRTGRTLLQNITISAHIEVW